MEKMEKMEQHLKRFKNSTNVGEKSKNVEENSKKLEKDHRIKNAIYWNL